MGMVARVTPGRLLVKVIGDMASGYDDGADDDYCLTSVRCNGRIFHIDLSPSNFHDSPVAEARYRTFLSAVRRRCEFHDEAEEKELEDVEKTFHEWLLDGVFQPVFAELAPEVPPSFDPDKIRSGEATPLLSEYLYAPEFWYKLEVSDETPTPVPDSDAVGFALPGAFVDEGLLDDLGACGVKSVHPSAIEVAFREPDDALNCVPSCVLVNLDANSSQKTTCLFEAFHRALHPSPYDKKLEVHLQILEAEFTETTRVTRLLGIVRDDDGFVLGMLLSYVDYKGRNGLLGHNLEKDTPLPLREKWARQVRETLADMHAAGIVWGDAQVNNVMVDKDDNTWITNMGRGYHPGWVVDEDKAGTVAGDLQGIEKIVKFILDPDWYISTSEDGGGIF